jgi:hypothetical protein
MQATLDNQALHQAGQTVVLYPSPAAIAIRAHELHRARSGTYGCDLNDWLQAERELKAANRNAPR